MYELDLVSKAVIYLVLTGVALLTLCLVTTCVEKCVKVFKGKDW